MVPYPGQVIGERQQRRTLVVAQYPWLLLLQAPDLLLKPCSRRQAFIPSPFELTGDEPVVGVNRVILSARMRHFVARLLQCHFTLPQPFATGLLAVGNQLQRRIMPSGEIARSTSAETAASTRILLNAMHFLSLA